MIRDNGAHSKIRRDKMAKISKRNNITIGNRVVGYHKPCFIIAEAGSNHNGDLKMAKKLISTAAEMGADAIKFQLFTADGLSSDRKVQQILKKYEFKREWLFSLKKYADSKRIMFLATPFDEEAVDLLGNVGVAAFKVASGDLNYLELLKFVAKKKKPIFLSVGMAADTEINEAIDTIRSEGNNEIILLHCISDYPASPEYVNLLRIEKLRNKFSLPVGFSDHTLGIHISLSSVCFGAVVIEKHFTLNRKLHGLDHSFAIEPPELQAMVKFVREIEVAKGDGIRRLLKCEEKGLFLGRRSIFARRDIIKNSFISEDDLKVVRPCIGISPKFYSQVVGKKSRQTIKSGEPITWGKIG